MFFSLKIDDVSFLEIIILVIVHKNATPLDNVSYLYALISVATHTLSPLSFSITDGNAVADYTLRNKKPEGKTRRFYQRLGSESL